MNANNEWSGIIWFTVRLTVWCPEICGIHRKIAYNRARFKKMFGMPASIVTDHRRNIVSTYIYTDINFIQV